MADLTPERVREALRAVLFPNFRRDVVTLGMVSDVRVDGGTVEIDLRPGTDNVETRTMLVRQVERVAGSVPGVRWVRVGLGGAAGGRGRDRVAVGAALSGGSDVI